MDRAAAPEANQIQKKEPSGFKHQDVADLAKGLPPPSKAFCGLQGLGAHTVTPLQKKGELKGLKSGV
jgi:hypothetical protein